MPINLIIEQQDTVILAKVCGRLDTSNSAEFEKLMQPLMEGERPHIEMDCAELNYIASSGLRLLLTLRKSVMARKGELIFRNINPDIKAVFDMTGFSTIFTIL